MLLESKILPNMHRIFIRVIKMTEYKYPFFSMPNFPSHSIQKYINDFFLSNYVFDVLEKCQY